MASKTGFYVLGGVLLAAGGVAYWATTARVSTHDMDKIAQRVANSEVGKAVNDAAMTPEERKAYIEANVIAEGIEVGVDTKEGDNGETVRVPGLLRATGIVKNTGDRPVTPVTLQIVLMGKEGEDAVGAYYEEVTAGQRLEPGASRPFRFTLPDKKEWGGTFKHSLK